MLRPALALTSLLGAAAVGCGASSHPRATDAQIPDAQTPDAQLLDASAPDAGREQLDGSLPREQDASAVAGVLASDRLLAAGCRQLRMTPETPQSLGFQLVLCGDSLGRIALPGGALTALATVKSAPAALLVTRERALLQLEGDQLVSVSLGSGEAVALGQGVPLGLSHDQHSLIADVAGMIHAQPLDGTGLPLPLCAAAGSWHLNAEGTRIVCAQSTGLVSVDIDSGAAQVLLPDSVPSLPSLLDEPAQQLAVLDDGHGPTRKLRVLRTDGRLRGEWSVGERNPDALLAFSVDGDSVIIGEGERLWSVSLRDGSFRALANRPTGKVLYQRTARAALIFETAAKVNDPVTVSAVPLDGTALVTLGVVSSEYWTDGQWDNPLADDVNGALYPAASPAGWSLSNFETLTTSMLPLEGIVQPSVVPSSFYGLSASAAAYPLCDHGWQDCVLVVVDRAAHVLMHIPTRTMIDSIFFGPSAEHVVVAHDGVLDLASRGGALQRFQPGSAPAPMVSWLDARSFLYDGDGVHLVQLRD